MRKLSLILVLLLFGYFRALSLGGFIDRGPTTGWEDQGSGEYYDGLVCDLFPELEAGTHWEVQIQNNPENPGWYRFIPFSGEWPGVDIAGESEVYMIINASDPDKVYMCDTDKILRVNGWQYIFSQNVPENLEEGSMYGTLSNGVVTFPANSFINYKCSPAESHDRTQQTTVNRTGLLKIVLPETSSISAINADNQNNDVQYYNMHGCKVENPSRGVYIKKTSRGAERVIIQ
ncbi:MAG: hypothetical protein ACI304_04040 [Lepagella sp.]